ncbi:MAG: hypothetical protein SOW48_03535 [Peptoniphilaceae bacterium]|nr:hypothetical protein [Peptoniphilaceae bacterium]MDD7433938.1 hypothetical protein [Peptoniphilaceae bacterium]MDY3075700.1 hypothetical protein [Peptoniphilaceae bacterium]MDY4195901.1 hypothetical protein [Peptoniphilaceae bacterium]
MIGSAILPHLVFIRKQAFIEQAQKHELRYPAIAKYVLSLKCPEQSVQEHFKTPAVMRFTGR